MSNFHARGQEGTVLAALPVPRTAGMTEVLLSGGVIAKISAPARGPAAATRHGPRSNWTIRLRDLRGMTEDSDLVRDHRTRRFAALSVTAPRRSSHAGCARDRLESRRSIAPKSATKDADLQGI